MSNQSKNPKIELIGQKLQEKFPEPIQIRVFARATQTASLKEIWSNARDESVLGLDGERILGSCEKRLRSILVHDSSKDLLLKAAEGKNFASCLCAPVLDDSKQLVGILYLSSKSPESFGNEDRYAIEQIARTAAGQLRSIQNIAAEKPDTPPKAGFDFLFNPGTLMSAAVLSVFLLIYAFSLSGSQVDLTAEASVVNSKQGPREVAGQVAQHMRVGEFAQAWEIFDPTLQAEWPREAFVKDMRAWSQAELHQALLLNKKLSDIKYEDQAAFAIFYESTLEGDTGRWAWGLTKTSGEWRLNSITGGPVPSPRAAQIK